MPEATVTPNVTPPLALGDPLLSARPQRSILPLRASGLTFGAGGVRIIDGVDLELARGGCTAIMGYNGAGKSVLLRLLHGLLRPTSGTVRWSLDLPARDLARRQAMVFQHPVMLRRSVADNVRYALRAHGLPTSGAEPALDRLLVAADLAHLADRPAPVLSGGERQRLALVRALATRPEILFLDEPTASLDPSSAATIESLVADARARGTTIVLVTQSVAQGRRLADDVAFLHEGRIVERAPAGTFFAGPASPAARAFVEGRLLP